MLKLLSMSQKFLFIVLILSLGITGCASSKKKSGSDSINNESSSSFDESKDSSGEEIELSGDSDNKKAGGLSTVYFDYNSAGLRQDTLDTLNKNVTFLKSKPKVKVQIEGHCDERGSVQFNLALGEKRAKSIKEFLVSNGIESNRISVISLGKERPVTFGHDESAWSQNRRGNFVITAK